MMQQSEIDERIDDLTDDGEFWRSDTRQSLIGSVAELENYGMTGEEAVSFIEDMWSLVSGEFGN